MSKKSMVDKIVEVYSPKSKGDASFIELHKNFPYIETHYSPDYPDMDDILTARHINTYVRREHGRNHPVKGEKPSQAGGNFDTEYNNDHGYMPGEDENNYFPHSVNEGIGSVGKKIVSKIKDTANLYSAVKKHNQEKHKQNQENKDAKKVNRGQMSADDAWKKHGHGTYHAADGNHYDYKRTVSRTKNSDGSTSEQHQLHVRKRGSKSNSHETFHINKDWSNEQGMRHHKGSSHIEHIYSNPETKPKVEMNEGFVGGLVGAAVGGAAGSLVGAAGIGAGAGYVAGSQLYKNVMYKDHFAKSKENHDKKVKSLISRGWKPYTNDSYANDYHAVKTYYSNQYASGNGVPRISDMKRDGHKTTLLYKGSNFLTGRAVAMAAVHYPKVEMNENIVYDGKQEDMFQHQFGINNPFGRKTPNKPDLKRPAIDPEVFKNLKNVAPFLKTSVKTVAEMMVQKPDVSGAPPPKQGSSNKPPKKPTTTGPYKPDVRDSLHQTGSSGLKPMTEERFVVKYVMKHNLKEGVTKPWNNQEDAIAQAHKMFASDFYDSVEVIDESVWRHVGAAVGIAGGAVLPVNGMAAGALGAAGFFIGAKVDLENAMHKHKELKAKLGASHPETQKAEWNVFEKARNVSLKNYTKTRDKVYG